MIIKEIGEYCFKFYFILIKKLANCLEFENLSVYLHPDNKIRKMRNMISTYWWWRSSRS